jgi:ABC-type nitrate/sulfonate/bicarbonate transport system permease component
MKSDMGQKKASSIVLKKAWRMPRLYWLVGILGLVAIWQIACWRVGSVLLLPSPLDAMQALVAAVQNPKVLRDLLVTMQRVILGFGVAVLVGLPLGYMMGYSRTVMQFLDPVMNTLRTVPIMAWVPLTILWFGLGDGPTIFLIAFSGIFPIILNTIAGVHDISKDYYNAARSMGAGRFNIFRRVVVPGSMPSILTGMRLALGTGWMSVI